LNYYGVSIDRLILTQYNINMNNLTLETKAILDIIKKFGPLRPSEIVKISKISIKNVYKHLSRLLDEDLVKKTGATPRVFYSIKIEENEEMEIKNLNDYLIEQNYVYISPDGEIARGINGFNIWCKKNGLNFIKEKDSFQKKLKELQKKKKNGLFSAKNKILSGSKNLYLDDIYFSDFYTIDHFGKTKLGQLVYIGKTSQDKDIVKEIVKNIRPVIKELINKKNIKQVGFIPPTIDRKIQFMDILKKELQINLKEVQIDKITEKIKIPQKTLRKLEDRIINAKNSIVVNPTQIFDGNILIIDDATGSGATLNETAKKIKNINKNIKVFGYSIVGSYKNFDIINEI